MAKRTTRPGTGTPPPARAVTAAAVPAAAVMAGGRPPTNARAPKDARPVLAADALSILSTSDAGRFTQFPQFGQVGRTGLLSQTGSFFGGGSGGGASRVYNPDRVSLAEYDEMALYPVIRSCLLGYALVMQTADLSVSCPDSSMKALIESVLLPRLPQLMRETVMPAQTFGWADAEVVWETRYNVPVDLAPTTNDPAAALAAQGLSPADAPQRVIPYVTAIRDFVPLPNDTLTLRQSAQGQFAGAVQWAWGQSFLPPSRLFHYPLGGMFRNPYGQPLTKSLYPFWVWARFLWETTMVAVERGAVPPLIGRYPAGLRVSQGVDATGAAVQQDAGDFLMSQLGQLRSFATAVFPRQLDPNGNDLYSVEELPLDAHVDWMTQVIDLCHRQMMLGLFFPDKLMQSGDVGSYALAKEHTDLFSLAVKSRLDEFLYHVNEGPVKQFVRFNDRTCPDAAITYAAPNIEAMQAFAMAAVQAMTSGQCLVGPNQDRILVPDWQGWADDLGLKYEMVRRTDGLDAFGRPLAPGADPDQQDQQGAQALGLAPGADQGGAQGGQAAAQGAGGPQAGAQAARTAPEGQAPESQAPAPAVRDPQFEQDSKALLSESVPGPSLTGPSLTELPQGVVALDDAGAVVPHLTPVSANLLGAMAGKPSADMDELTAAHGGTQALAAADTAHLAYTGLAKQATPPGPGQSAAYSVTPLGGQALAQHNALKAHILSALHAGGPQDYYALTASAKSTVHPGANISGAALHLMGEGHLAETPQPSFPFTNQYSLTPQGQAAAQKAPPVGNEAEGPVAAGTAKPGLLNDDHAAVLKHLQDNQDALGAKVAGQFPDAAIQSGLSSGHIVPVAGNSSEHFLTASGQRALAAHEAATVPSAPGHVTPDAHVTLNGQKFPLSGGQADQPATPEHTAALLAGQNAHPDVKKKIASLVAGGGVTQGQLAATAAMASAAKNADGHNKLLMKHLNAALPYGHDLAAFQAGEPGMASHLGDHALPQKAEAEAQAGEADAAKPTAPLWDGKSVAPGWEESLYNSFPHYATKNTDGKMAHVYQKADGTFHAATKEGDGYWNQTVHGSLADAYAHASQELGVDAPQVPAPATDQAALPAAPQQPDPFKDDADYGAAKPPPATQANPPATQADVDAAVKGKGLHPDAKKKMADALGQGMTKAQAEAVVTQAVQNQQAAGTGKVNPAHVQAALLTHGPGSAPSPPQPAAPQPVAPPAAEVTPPGAGTPPAAGTAPGGPVTSDGKPAYVTVHKGGQAVKATLAAAPVKPAELGKAKADYGLSNKGSDALAAAAKAGTVKTQGDLAQVMAAAHAVNQSGPHQAVTGYSVDKALAYGQHPMGTLAGMKAAAEGGDAQAQAHAAALGPHNVLSPQEHEDAAQEAHHADLTGDDIMHHPLGMPPGSGAGSNPGGLYQAKDGGKWYVKENKGGKDQNATEALANRIYSDLGLSAPRSKLFSQGGKDYHATPWVDGAELGQHGLTPALAQEALRGHVADVLTQNRDAAGTGLNNMKVGADGKGIHRIDQGGALLYRAQGQKKNADALHRTSEWDTLSDPAVAPDYAKLFHAAGVGSADELPGVEKQIQAVQDLSAKHGGWQAYVDKHAPEMSAGGRASTAAMLTARTAALGAKKDELVAQKTEMLPRDYQPQDYHELKAHAQGVHKTPLPAPERAGITAFKGGGYSDINAAVRGGNIAGASAEVQAHVKNLDKLFARPETTLGKDMILSRKVSASSYDDETKHIAAAQPGKVLIDPGYGSTSTDSGTWHGNHHLQLHVPAEAKAVLPGVYTKSNEDEQEVTLPRNHEYRVLSVHEPGQDKLEGDPDGWKWQPGAKRIKAEVVVPGVNDDAALAKKLAAKKLASKNATG